MCDVFKAEQRDFKQDHLKGRENNGVLKKCSEFDPREA